LKFQAQMARTPRENTRLLLVIEEDVIETVPEET